MLVIHPKDRTTAMLTALYDGMPDAQLLDCTLSGKAIAHVLSHTPQSERIMLLGHGCDRGLFWREDDTKDGFDRIVVGHSHAYYLRRHGGIIVAVFCNADIFAKSEGLHGLYTGMIITEMSEAALYGIKTTQDELDRENDLFASRLRSLLDKEVPLHHIPLRMKEMDDARTPLTTFNYNNIHYL